MTLHRTAAALLAFTLGAVSLSACGPELRPAVSLRLKAESPSPRDAAVFIDEEYIGPLSVVSAKGVRLPEGTHRITVEKTGYFPWDREVVAGRHPIALDVRLEPIPE